MKQAIETERCTGIEFDVVAISWLAASTPEDGLMKPPEWSIWIAVLVVALLLFREWARWRDLVVLWLAAFIFGMLLILPNAPPLRIATILAMALFAGLAQRTIGRTEMHVPEPIKTVPPPHGRLLQAGQLVTCIAGGVFLIMDEAWRPPGALLVRDRLPPRRTRSVASLSSTRAPSKISALTSIQSMSVVACGARDPARRRP